MKNRNIPSEFIPIWRELPENGETVSVLTKSGRKTKARFEKFLGNFLWETTELVNDNETVIAWKR